MSAILDVVAPEAPDVGLVEFVLGPAQSRPGKRAVIEPATGRELTYSQLTSAVRRTGAGMVARGVAQGDVVAVCAPNSVELLVAVYAALSIGAIVTTTNPVFTREEIVRLLDGAGARWLVTTADLFEQKLEAAAEEVPIVETFVIGLTAQPHPHATPFASLAAGTGGEAMRVPAAEASNVALLPTSSGTTGLPKHVMLTHRSLVAGVSQVRLGHPVREDDVVLLALPMFHISGFETTALTLLEGASVVLMPGFELDSFLAAVQSHRVTRAEVVPPIVRGLAHDARVDDYDLSSLRVLTSLAAPLGSESARACAERLGCQVKQLFGMTEFAGATHVAPDGGPDRPDSVGPPLPGVECRIVDHVTGTDVALGDAGELLIRSASAMRGYLNDPAMTAATIDAEGWLHTGDIVTIDAQGWYRVTDRIKELIKSNGHQVAPAELENVLLTHPAVADAAVVRSPDRTAGEVPKAFVVLRTAATSDDLTTWVAERVAPYKQIRRVEFVDQIPRSAAGKILRRTLAERERVTHPATT